MTMVIIHDMDARHDVSRGWETTLSLRMTLPTHRMWSGLVLHGHTLLHRALTYQLER